MEKVLDGMNQQMLKLHNKVRKEHNRSPLSLHPKLREAAQQHAASMKNQGELTHQPPLGERIRKAGYNWAACAENIAWGGELEKPDKTFYNQWMGSSGHKENILKPEIQDVGFGCAFGASGQPYWCAIFAKQG
jgi:uncharacterized protein YkwD